MDRFLDEQHRQGILDSRGGFTIDAQKARRKLVAFQQAEPGAYLLKFVQAAVAAGATALSIKVGRDDLTVTFACDDTALQNPHLVAGALFHLPAEHRALRHLASGLNAACGLTPLEVLWRTPAGTVAVSQENVRLLSDSFGKLTLVVQKPRPVLGWFRGTLFLDEVSRIEQACRYAPLELRVDGRLLERPRWGRLANTLDHVGLPAPHFLLELARPAARGAQVSYPPESYERLDNGLQLWAGEQSSAGAAEPTAAPLLVEGWDGASSTLTVSAVLGIPPSVRGDGQLIPVQDGVTLAPLRDLDLGHPGLQVLLDATDLTADLSEFALVRDAALDQKLDWIRETVVRARQELDPASLRLGLTRSGLEPNKLERVLERALGLLRNQAGGERTVEDLVNRCFAGSQVLLAPDIPDKKLARARQVHAGHLPESERVLALYDDTVFGGATEGFLVTEHRLCWKGTLEGPGFAFWSDMAFGEPCKMTEKGVEVLGYELRVVMFYKEVAPLLFDLVKRVTDLAPAPLHLLPESQRRILELGMATLGRRERFSYNPSLSPAWLSKLPTIYGSHWSEGEQALIAYDDTVMGGADNGFVVTADRLLWKNTFAEPQSLLWSELAASRVKVASLGVEVDGREIFIHVKALREPAARFFQGMARL